MKKIIFILTFMLCLSGCGSISSRIGNYKSIEPGPYPSVRSDTQVMKSITKKDYDPLLTGAEPVVFTAALLDIPLAAVLDTILLPYDMAKPNAYKQKIAKLFNKYLPDYKITKNPNVSNKEAYFYLISQSGEKIDLINNQQLVNFEFIYPELDDILKQEDIRVESSNEAIEIVELMNLLMYGRVIAENWQYEANREDQLWKVKIIDKKTGKLRLGHIWELEIENNNVLRKICSHI